MRSTCGNRCLVKPTADGSSAAAAPARRLVCLSDPARAFARRCSTNSSATTRATSRVRLWDGSGRGPDPGQPERVHVSAQASWRTARAALAAFAADDGRGLRLRRCRHRGRHPRRLPARRAPDLDAPERSRADPACRRDLRPAVRAPPAHRTRSRPRSAGGACRSSVTAGPSPTTTTSRMSSSRSTSTAQWSTPAPTSTRRDDDLDSAQERKLEYLCRKLRLRPGERLLDIGCGWGALVMHAAEHYGVEAVGITLSRPQAELANERIRAAGLENRCRVEVADYRELDEPEAFDKVVSVCMFEAVAEDLLPDFFARSQSFLEPGGVFVNQGHRPPLPRRRGIDRRALVHGPLRLPGRRASFRSRRRSAPRRAQASRCATSRASASTTC